jgi:Ca-activated chloride channel family protein
VVAEIYGEINKLETTEIEEFKIMITMKYRPFVLACGFLY